MAVLQMQRMNLVAMKQNRKAILERLQEFGALEIDVKLEETQGILAEDTSGQRTDFEKQAATADAALEVLDVYAAEKKSLLASLEGKPLVERSAYDDVEKNREAYMEKAEEIVHLEKEITEAKATIQKLLNQQEMLEPWKSLDFPMDTEGTARTVLFLGTIGEMVSEEDVLAALKTHEPAVDAADVNILSSGKDGTWLSALCLKEDAQAAEDALRGIGFAKPSYVVHDIPAKAQADMDGEIAALQKKIDELATRIVSLSEYRHKFELVSDYYRLRAEKYEVMGTLPQTANTFALSGYVPKNCATEIANELTDSYEAVVELEEVGDEEEAPVALKNNAFSNSMDGILESYGLPKKGEIDPTFFMSVFYVFLFGMMLSDAAYGALIVIVCGIALLKFPRMNPGLRKSIKMFFFCGISTVFWGVMFGSYFGDVVQVISREYFGNEVAIPALWFEPLNDPMRLLVFCMLLGLIHMFLGFGIKGYEMLKAKDYVGFFCDIVAWFMLLVGLILIFLPTSIFESISNMTIRFPEPVNLLAKVIAVAGALIILVMSGRRKGKRIVLRLLLGAYDIYGITSWLSDLLSYSRLLALGLATGVIAQVINQIGTMFGTGVFGTIVFILVFIIGNALNMFINILGAYVHSNRLEYVEFFNKFYEGGGRPFAPFTAVTKYVSFVRSK